MSVVKVIEILAQSPDGWEAAAQEAVSEASKSVKNIQHVYVKDFQAIVEEDKIKMYRLNAKISFLVGEQ
ncbi:MAG: dodecin domain-containing protein [candidate division Zixibacteria bacterium]|jgi:dodecin|nr:dodecin domain-containing protein [candidate division Zixibacteria bacterium]